MTTDAPSQSQSSPEPTSPKGRSWLGTLLRLLFVVVTGAVVAGAMALWLATSGGLTDRIASVASDALGRKISLGTARIGLGSPLNIHVEEVAIANPSGSGTLLTAKSADARVALNWTPPWSFAPEVTDVTVESPVLDITTAADGTSNLDFSGTSGDKAGVMAWPKTASVKNGKVSVTAAGAEPIVADEIVATVVSDAATGKTSAKGSLNYNNDPAEFDATFADLKMATAGLPTGLVLTLSGPRLKAKLDGQAVIKGEPQYTGAAKLETPAVGDLMRWIDPKSTAAPGGAPASLDGTIKARGGELTLDGASVALGETQAKIDGTLSTGGERPKLTGTVAMARIDLSGVSGKAAAAVEAATRSAAPAAEDETATVEFSIDADPAGFAEQLRSIQTGQPAPQRAAPEPTVETLTDTGDDDAATRGVKAAPPKPVWSESEFDFKTLKQADLDIVLVGDTVDFGDVDIAKARIKTKLDNGKLAADIEDAAVAGGKATGKIVLDSTAAKPTADITLNLTAVSAEPIVTAFTGKPFLSGTTDSTIVIKATGANLDAMANSLAGSAKFKMAKGSFRGIDVKREANNFCLSELIGGYIFGSKKTFQVDLKQKTGFERLEADYTIKNGVMKSLPGLALGGSDVEINSKGEVSLARKLVNQNVKLRVVPPPQLPAVPVILSGSWNKIAFKLDTSAVDWVAVLNAAVLGCSQQPRAAAAEARSLGASTEAAPDATSQALPDSVRAAIEGALSADGSTLNDTGKAALRALLPAEADAPAAPAEAPAAAP